MNQPHPDEELLSASLDGEAVDPAVSAHVDGCAACRSQLNALDAARRSVAAAPGPAPGGFADRAVRAALGAWSEERAGNVLPLRRRDDPKVVSDVGGLASSPRRRLPAWALGAAAAVAALLVAVPVVAGLDDGPGDQQTASSPRQALARTKLGAADAAPVEGGDLGEQSDQGALGRIVEDAVNGGGDESGPLAAGAPENTAAAEDAAGPAALQGAPAAPAPAAAPGRSQTQASTAANTSPSAEGVPCAAEVRADYGQGLGPLVYRATVRWQGAPAVVLGYRLADADGVAPDHRAFVMAIDGCRLLVVQGF